MSRSYRKAIIKDTSYKASRRYRPKEKSYWAKVRSKIKTVFRSSKDLEELELPSPKTIVNDAEVCDYVFDYEYKHKNRNSAIREKIKRK